LRAARQDLNDAPYFLVAADDRIGLVLARQVGEVAAVFVEGLVFPFGVLIGDALVTADVLECAQNALVCHAQSLQGLTRVALVLGHGEKEMLGRDVLVTEGFRILLRLLEHAPKPRRCGELHVAADLRLSLELGRERGRELRWLHAQRRQDARDDPTRLIDERRGEMLDIELRMALVARLLLRRDERLLRLLSQFVWVNHFVTCSISGLRPGDSFKTGHASLRSANG